MEAEETTMIALPEEQQQALAAGKAPLQVVNPHTQQVYVLVPQEIYERLCKLVEGPNRRGWDDPELDVYEQYRKKP
jgi:hypothetical protein